MKFVRHARKLLVVPVRQVEFLGARRTSRVSTLYPSTELLLAALSERAWCRSKATFLGLAGVLLLASTSADAAYVQGDVGRLTTLYSHTTFGAGDIVMTVESPLATCQSGFYLSPSSDGFEQTYAMLLAAWHAQTPLRISAYDDQLWSGSGGQYCRVYSVGYVP